MNLPNLVEVLVEGQVSHHDTRGKIQDTGRNERGWIRRRQLQRRVWIPCADSRPDDNLQQRSSIRSKPRLRHRRLPLGAGVVIVGGVP